jgi:hypothetical protein
MSPLHVTQEATPAGVALGAEVGSAFRRSVDHFLENVAQSGAKTTVGDFEVAVAAEDAEPLLQPDGGSLRVVEPHDGENAHLEVVVMDADDGRFVPELDVTATLTSGGNAVGTWRLPFLWHPTMYHYGRNVAIPNPGGTYDLLVEIAPASFGRHDKVNGRRFATAQKVSFDGLRIEGGRKT